MALVLGTAGHIDHGKTSLVRALTGIDCDRLEEEKRRGITIELGFAWAELPDGERLGIVDVPGHERFVKNMVAGAAGVDFVMLVIAADTGEVLHGPEMISRGFVFEQLYEHVLEDSKCLVLDQLEDMAPHEYDRLQEKIRSSMRRFFRDVLGRDPVVLPVVSVV